MIQQARSAGDLELFGERGQALAAHLGDEHRVLDAHAGEPLDVDARLDGADHARGEHVAAGPAQPGGLVHFEAHPVAGAVAELLAVARGLDDGAGGRVDVAAPVSYTHLTLPTIL